MRLESGTIAVRSWQDGDAEAVTVQANDRRVWLGLRDRFPHPYTIDDARRFIAKAGDDEAPTNLAIEVAGRVAGGIGYTQGRDVERIGAEIGYWLGHEFWGLGIATTALRLVTAHAFAVTPGLERIYALPYATNAASARVLEKAGYRLEGTLRRSASKDGRVLDQFMYSILREEVEAE